MSTEPPPRPPAGPLRAAVLLRVKALWLAPVVVGAVFVVVMTVLYVGAAIAPVEHLRGLPVAVVDRDAGVTVDGRRVDLGERVSRELLTAPVVSSKLGLTAMSLSEATARMDRDDAYTTVVIPPGFTASLLAVAGAGPPGAAAATQPEITLLTNPRSGTQGVGLATGVLGPALDGISRALGRELQARGGPTGPAARALLADPVAQRTVQYRPLGSHTALGLSAFYVALLTLMCGFVGATIVNAAVDGALGFGGTEMGPRWQQRLPQRISHWQTLLTKWAMVVPVAGLLTGVMLVVGIALLGMQTPDPFLLWVFAWFAALTVGVATIGLLAVLGTQGQLVALVLFVYIGLSSAGGTVPLEALPDALRAVSQVDPLRQILDGVRSIMYFDARGDAGLTRGVAMTGLGLVFWLVLASWVVRTYDRRGLVRIEPDLLARLHEAVGRDGRREEDGA